MSHLGHWDTMTQRPTHVSGATLRRCDGCDGMSQYTEVRGKPNPYIGRCTGSGNPLRLPDVVDNLFFCPHRLLTVCILSSPFFRQNKVILLR